MASKIDRLNHLLAQSTAEFDRVLTTILPAEYPLNEPPPNGYKTSDHKSSRAAYDVEEAEQNKTKSKFYNPSLQQNPESFDETSKKFYTPSKQKSYRISHINNQFSDRRVTFTAQKDRKLASQHPLLHKSAIELNGSAKIKISASKSCQGILDLDPHQVLAYVKSRAPLTPQSRPEQIFGYFYELVPYFQKPLIKKFKNCIFFGDSPRENGSSRYNGFLYFFNEKVYYGKFQQDHKHGAGVEINIPKSTIYQGTFQKGHKLGKFIVSSPNGNYEGHLHNGKYHGNGKLVTSISQYEGSFQAGCRHGKGQQYFFSSGLKIVGRFEMDKFSNQRKNDQSSQSSNSRLIQKHLCEPQKPKLTRFFQFSFHDDSDYQSPHTNFRRIMRRPNNARKMKEISQQDNPLPSYFKRRFSHN